jgi:transposase
MARTTTHDCSWRKRAEKNERAVKSAQLEIERLRGELEHTQTGLEESEGKLKTALAQIAEYERRLFGRTTERVVPVERELRRGDDDAITAAASGGDHEEDEPGAPVGGSKGNRKKRRRKRPENDEDVPGLRNETVEHPVSDRVRRCPHCGGTAQPMGTGKFTTEWDYVPGYFVRRRHIQEVVACECGRHVARAEAPLRVFDRTQYGPGLIAYLIVSKCGDAIPIYRVEKQFTRLGIPIARSTLNDLLHRAGEILEPLHAALLRRIVADAHCQADETSFRLHNRPDKRGFVWTFLSGKLVAYVFSKDRSGETPARVLGGTTGSLVVDGYTGYNEVTDVDGRDRGGCWSHCRRYYFRALEQTPEAREMLDMILELFRVERDALKKEVFGTAEHLEMRRARSQPVLDRIQTWAVEQTPKHLPNGPMGAALRYTTNQWTPLTLFMTDAKIPIHNNASEAALRIIALARKISLFFGNEEAGRNLAVLYSLAATAERCGLNPLVYFEDVLMRVQHHPASRIDDLLPDRWKPLYPEPATISRSPP